MLIGICDDSQLIREYVFEVCKAVAVNYGEKIEIRLYADGRELITDEPDILILDIEMPLKDGLQIKQELQNQKKRTIIIFVTGHDEMMPSAFGVNVMGFINKKDIKEQLPEMLKSAIKLSGNFAVIEGIDSRKIVYIKASHTYSEIHLADERLLTVRKSCKELEKGLVGHSFVKISRWYLVNIRYITRIKDKNVELADGTILAVSVRTRSEVKKKYIQYCRENAGFC